MASSSTSESGDQSTPTSPSHSGSPSPGDGCGEGAGTFAEFLDERRQYGGSDQRWLPSVLLAPALCGHCHKMEDLRRGHNSDNDSDGDGLVSAQMIAIEGNTCFTCVKMIIEATQWIDGGNHRRDTPLHHAARSGNLRMLFHLICQLGDLYGHEWTVLVVRKLNVHGETALHEAIRLGTNSMCMAGMLMWVDPGLAQHPRAGTSPLYLAVTLGHKHIAEMLLRTSGGNLSYSGPHGQNALHAAALRGAHDMIEMLLDWNKDLSREKDKNGSTPLHSVILAHSEDYIPRYRLCSPNVRFPLKKHATLCVLAADPSAAYQHDKNGLLPVHVAALMDRKLAILILLERCGGCIYLRDTQGRSFLHIAVQNKARRIVKYACEEPVFAPILNARDYYGNTALHLAVEVEDLVIFCSLLRNPDVLLNVRNTEDQTPLDLATSKIGVNFSYVQNTENVIYMTLINAGAKYGSYWRDHVQQLSIQNLLSNQRDEENQSEEADAANHVKEADPVKVLQQKDDKEKEEEKRKKKEDEEKKDSDQMNDMTRTLGLLSVLITTMTFGATFSVPAVMKAGDRSNGGIFNARNFRVFMTANTTAFVCSLIATFCLMFSGMSIFKLQFRRYQFRIAMFFTWSSLTSLTVAFGLGVLTVLHPHPVGLILSNIIVYLSPLVPVYQSWDFVRGLVLTYQPLSVRRGHKFVCLLFTSRISRTYVVRFWPFLFFALAVVMGPDA